MKLTIAKTTFVLYSQNKQPGRGSASIESVLINTTWLNRLPDRNVSCTKLQSRFFYRQFQHHPDKKNCSMPRTSKKRADQIILPAFRWMSTRLAEKTISTGKKCLATVCYDAPRAASKTNQISSARQIKGGVPAQISQLPFPAPRLRPPPVDEPLNLPGGGGINIWIKLIHPNEVTKLKTCNEPTTALLGWDVITNLDPRMENCFPVLG